MQYSEKQKRLELFVTKYIKNAPQALYDIGVGPKSEWKTLGEYYPDMKIFGVEANPRMYDFILDEGFPGMLLNNAVFSESGSMELKMYREDGLDASILSIQSRKVSATYIVECITLDEADNKFGNQNEILLWMDIEGAELAALISGTSLLRSRRVKWINLEVRENPPWDRGCKASEVDAFLTSQGFSKVAEYNKHPHVGHYDAIYTLNS